MQCTWHVCGAHVLDHAYDPHEMWFLGINCMPPITSARSVSGDHGWHDHIQSSGSTQPQWWIAHQQHDNVGEATDLHGELRSQI